MLLSKFFSSDIDKSKFLIITLKKLTFIYCNKKITFLTIAEKRQIMETAVVGGNFFYFYLFYHNKKLHVKFGCFKIWRLAAQKRQNYR